MPWTSSSIGRVNFLTPYLAGTVPVVTMTGGNGESLSFVYGGPQPDSTGFSFYANQQNGATIGSGSGVRVCYIAVGRTA